MKRNYFSKRRTIGWQAPVLLFCLIPIFSVPVVAAEGVAAEGVAAEGVAAEGVAAEGVAAESEHDLDFRLSADPGKALLKVHYEKPGLPPSWRAPVILFGDGRLVQQRIDGATKKISQEEILRLDYSEMREWMQEIVSFNLLESSSEDIENKIRSRRKDGDLPHISDSAYLVVEINLESYVSKDISRSDVHHVIRLDSGGYLSRLYPNIEELQGLTMIVLKLNELKERASDLGSLAKEGRQ